MGQPVRYSYSYRAEHRMRIFLLLTVCLLPVLCERTEILTKIIFKPIGRPLTSTMTDRPAIMRSTTTEKSKTPKSTIPITSLEKKDCVSGQECVSETTNESTTKKNISNPTPEQDKDCKADQKCVNEMTCNNFQQEKKIYKNLEKNTTQYNTTEKHLRSLVCNKYERKVCCDITEIVSSTPPPERPRTKTPPPTGCANPDSPCHRPSLEEEKCGLDNSDTGFFGVEGTRIGEFPFLVLLGSKRGGDSVSWQCGGTLINKWYVLTAASCGEVDYVRLREWRIVDPEDPDSFTPSSPSRYGKCYYYNQVSHKKCKASNRCRYCVKQDHNMDCDRDKAGKYERCNEKEEEISVAEVKRHENFNDSQKELPLNDIMLVKLSRPVEYDYFTRPVCLPSKDIERFGELMSAIFDNNIGRVVGWGEKNKQISVQRMARAWAVDSSECQAQFNKTASVRPDSEQHLCTRGREGEERETCSITGTGEPLMGRLNDLSPWQLIGVASGGGARCEAGGLEVFTRVTNYDEWIRENMVDQREHGLKD